MSCRHLHCTTARGLACGHQRLALDGRPRDRCRGAPRASSALYANCCVPARPDRWWRRGGMWSWACGKASEQRSGSHGHAQARGDATTPCEGEGGNCNSSDPRISRPRGTALFGHGVPVERPRTQARDPEVLEGRVSSAGLGGRVEGRPIRTHLTPAKSHHWPAAVGVGWPSPARSTRSLMTSVRHSSAGHCLRRTASALPLQYRQPCGQPRMEFLVFAAHSRAPNDLLSMVIFLIVVEIDWFRHLPPTGRFTSGCQVN